MTEKIPEAAWLEMLAEECSELAHAALKLARIQRGENPTPATEDTWRGKVIEEMADIMICLDIVKDMDWIDHNRMAEIRKFKLKRMEKRIRDSERYTGGV